MNSIEKPLVSFVLFAYQVEQFIREAVEGAFSQTYSPLEIILSDDCSPDRTFAIMQEMAAAYKGPHKIILNRNEKNLGIGRHYSKVMGLASGEIVELAAGDDISLPHRTTKSWEILKENPEVMCVSLGLHQFTKNPYHALPLGKASEELVRYDIDDFMRRGFLINAPARAFRKMTHEYFGPLNDDCPVEDGPNILRCLLHGKAAHCPLIGVLYRWHGGNCSSPENMTKISFPMIYKEYQKSIEVALHKHLISEVLYEELQKEFKTRQAKWEALTQVNSASNKLSAFLKCIALSRHFPIKDKASFLRRLLGGKSIG